MSENIKLHNGDCLEAMKEIPDKAIDMISNSRSFADNFEIKSIVHTAHNGVEAIEFIV